MPRKRSNKQAKVFAKPPTQSEESSNKKLEEMDLSLMEDSQKINYEGEDGDQSWVDDYEEEEAWAADWVVKKQRGRRAVSEEAYRAFSAVFLAQR